MLFTEPLFALILVDFIERLSSLRNEKHISTKIKPLAYFIGAACLLRLASLIPDLFYSTERAVLITYEGGCHYQMTFELSPYYQSADLLFIGISMALMVFAKLWLKTNVLFGLWLFKLGVQILTIAF